MRNKLLHYSCQSRCENETGSGISSSEYCKCDPICLFLGDCCYDYLMKCDPRKLSFEEAIIEQANEFRRHAGQSSCSLLFKTEYDRYRRIYVVDGCPIDKSTDFYDTYCRNQSGTFANYLPVVARGIPYLNVYCAACHGVMLKDIDVVIGNSTVLCQTHFSESEYPLFHFYPSFVCAFVTLKHLVKYTTLMKRIREKCLKNIDPPIRYCLGGKYQEECYAYKTAYGERFTAKNRACVACSLNGNTTIEPPQWWMIPLGPVYSKMRVQFFRFSETYANADVCEELQFWGKPGNRCLVKKCQPGFRLHDGHCISVNHSTSCLEPHENAFSDVYNVADLFRPALLVIIEHGVKRQTLEEHTDLFREKIVNAAEPCSEIHQNVYHLHLREMNQDGSRCYLIYSTALSYQSIVQMMESGEIERHLFPGSRLIKVAVTNHDPVMGLSCSGDSGSYVLTHSMRNSVLEMEFQSRESDRIVFSNGDPLVTIKDMKNRKITHHVLFCRISLGKNGCSLTNNHLYSTYENCPKYELTALPNSWSLSMTLKGGERLRNVDYLYSEIGNVLVCADVYDQTYANKLSGIVSSNYFSASLLYLLATFLAHLRSPPLHTLPGSMLWI